MSKPEFNELRHVMHQVIFNQKRDEAILRSTPSLFATIPKHKSLFHADDDRGMPIGDLSSQMLANINMNEVDQYAKRVIGCKQYIRYVDDILVIDKDSTFIRYAHEEISRFIHIRLKAELNPAKTIFNQANKGIDYLGYYILPGRTYVRHNTYKRVKNRLHTIKKNTPEKLTQSLASYNGIFGQSQTPMPTI